MNGKSLIVIISVIFFFGCKKSPDLEEPLQPVKITDLNIQPGITSATINFKSSRLPSGTTSVFLSTDSNSLSTKKTGEIKTSASYIEKDSFFNVIFPLLKSATTYWGFVTTQNEKGEAVYSDIFKFTTIGYQLQWQSGFSRQIKIDESVLFKDIIIVGEEVDPVKENYQVLIGTIPCQLWKIEKDNASGKYLFYIQVPQNTPKGKYPFKVLYNGTSIFTDEIEVLQGNLYYLSKVNPYPSVYNENMVYFLYNKSIYVVDWTINTGIDKMDTESGLWSKVHAGRLSESYLALTGNGYQINNRIWFPPYSVEDNKASIYSYGVETNSWSTIKFPVGVDILFNASLCSFVHENKVYYVIQGYKPKQSGTNLKSYLMVFDPANNSNTKVMELPPEAGYRGISINGKVYLVASHDYYMPGSSQISYKYILYRVSLTTKALEKKPDALYYNIARGTLKPNIFAFENKLCLFGGFEFDEQANPDIYYFDTDQDKWTHLFLSPNFDIPAQGGFSYPVGRDIYIGTGLRMRLQRTSEVWKFQFNH